MRTQMRTQKELGRREWALDQIIKDNAQTLEHLLTELHQAPENLINSVYVISYDEMSKVEIKSSVAYLKNEFINRVK